MKICPKCGLNRRLTSYYQRKTGSRLGKYYEKCKDCMKKRGRSYYYQTRERQLELVKIRRQRYIEERKKFVYSLKQNPCADCGKIYPPWVMDFDHRDKSLKIASISDMAINKTSTYEKIKKEIEKCDLVCANCHRQRTYQRGLDRKMPQ